MKTYLKQSIGMVVLCLALGVGMYPVSAQVNQPKKEQPQVAENKPKVWKPRAVEVDFSNLDPVPVYQPASDGYRKDLLAAMELHNMANAVQSMIDSNDYRDTLVDLALTERRMKDLENCNVAVLSQNFANPQVVWDKMKNEANRISQEYALSDVGEMSALSQSDVLEMAGLTGVDAQKTTTEQKPAEDTNNNETVANYIDWDIGRAILTDVYANQDKWGERKSKTSPSFALWNDQKYLYDTEVWNPKYTAINAYFGVNLNRRPQGMNEKKYDYYFYKDVQGAHQAYLATLVAQTGRPMPIGDIAAAPQVAPRPLAPRFEVVRMQINENNVYEGLYPSYPAPWKTFVDSGFAKYNHNGEMAELFNVNPSKRIVVAKTQAEASAHNRISRYLTTKYELNKKQEELEEQNNRVIDLKKQIESFADKNEIQLPAGINYADPKDLEQIKTLLLQERDAKVAKAKPDLMKKAQTTDSADKNGSDLDVATVDYNALANVLEMDKKAELALSFSNIDTAAEGIKEARANAELIALAKKEKQTLRNKELAELMKPIDNMCVNGGIQGTFNINAVQIP